jgi:hypothetical protein
MITITYLQIILALIILAVSVLVFPKVEQVYKRIKIWYSINRLFKRKKAELATFLKTNKHEWIIIPVMGRKSYVCKLTGYCPEIDGFMPMSDVDYYIRLQKTQDEMQEALNNCLTELMKKYPLKFYEMRDIADQIFKTTDEYLQKMDF